MIIGVDYWQVLSHYPEQFVHLIVTSMSRGDYVHIVSAVGKDRVGTIEAEVRKIFADQGYGQYLPEVHEVVFEHPRDSPQLKLAACFRLDIEVFYDDRDDVCKLLTANNILALRVGRRDNSTYDLSSERA